MEIEINFRFDENGRTVNTKKGDETRGDNTNEINYEFKAEMTDLKDLSESKLMDEILLDCEISDNLLMPRTYWMPADGTKARCTLEQFALDVFHHHVPSDGFDYDRELSGAEWWCQLRPSPELGRHKATCPAEENPDEDPFNDGISFHVDKDEELRILTGGSTYIHPHLSTITYMTALGAPTLIMDCQVHPLTGEWIVPDKSVEGFVSWPSIGKHTSFDGRYLHAAPPDLMGSKDAFQKQLDEASHNESSSSKATKRRCRRVTFLVNIWLNYRPYDVNPFPQSMIDKMSGSDTSRRLRFRDKSTKDILDASYVRKTLIKPNEAIEIVPGTGDKPNSSIMYKPKKFTWPLGDKNSKEELRCHIPLKSITESSKTGGNVKLSWERDQDNNNPSHGQVMGECCFSLHDGESNSSTSAVLKAENEGVHPGETNSLVRNEVKRQRVD